MELGYIGRKITHEYLPININAVPYMMTLGGQSFAKAYAGVEVALKCNVSIDACGSNVPTKKLSDGSLNPAYTSFINSLPKQAFFESAMKPGFCSGYSSCTAAVVDSELSGFEGQNVWDLYSDLDNGGFNFPRSMLNTPLAGTAPCPGSSDPTPCGANGQLTSGVGINASVGYGNYNAGFVTLRMNQWRGLTMQQNFTWSKALGTGAVYQATSEYTADDAFNIPAMYGVQPFDRKFVYNVFFVYQPPFYRNQSGFLGHVLGGWTFAPIFAAGSGEPMQVYTTNGGGEAFGEGDSVNFFSNETGILNGSLGQSTGSLHYNVCTGSNKASCNGIGTSGKGLNFFGDPAAAWSKIRMPILGLDSRNGGYGIFRGFPYWNLDMSLRKNFRVSERFSVEFSTIFTNVLNHMQPEDPNGYFTGTGNLDASSPSTFGTVAGQFNTPRQMEFGLRVNF
jgi:hypothetical protein